MVEFRIKEKSYINSVPKRVYYYLIQRKKTFLFWSYWVTLQEFGYMDWIDRTFNTKYQAEEYLNKLKKFNNCP